MTGENFDLESLKQGDTATQGGDKPSGDKPAGEQPAGDKAADQPGAASGDKPEGDKPAGDKPPGDQPSGDKPAADKPAGETPAGDKPAGEAAVGDKPSGDKPATPPTAEELKKQATEELLREAGVSSLEELKEKLKPKVELTEAQKREEAEKYEVNVDKYAVDNKVMTLEEIKALNNALKATDEQLAFAQYEVKYKEANKDATPEQIKQAFNLFYHIDATDETLKAAGAEAMKERASAMRNTLASKREMAKEAFDDHTMRSSKIPGYKQTIQSALKEYVPEQLEFNSGDGDDKVVFKVDPKQKTDLEKSLVGEETFEAYLKDGNSQQVRLLLKDKIEGLLLLKNKDLIIKTAYDAGVQKGTKQGSTTGATNSFAMNNNGGKPVEVDNDDTNLNQSEKDKLGVLFGGQ